MTPHEIARLIDEYRNEFKGKIPRPLNGDYEEAKQESEDFKRLVLTFHRRFGEFEIDRLRFAFEEHLVNGNGFFPKTTELFGYFEIKKDDFAHIPNHEQTAEIIRERERMIEEAQAMNTPEHQERMREYYAEAAKRLGIETDENSTNANRKFGSVRFDFDTE